ncbi:hypothetical protein GWI33_010393 [Rhynchophorus ferrugineus]|uniref:Uncharacterized protein n=1 Tax=Rhynchophorus ferrugineus TaxID=354439 RepID=A0A834MKE6_RHYFE|nr:hypothetical protein GWI33_010393 [Rhynchophorus ferrugineus]
MIFLYFHAEYICIRCFKAEQRFQNSLAIYKQYQFRLHNPLPPIPVSPSVPGSSPVIGKQKRKKARSTLSHANPSPAAEPPPPPSTSGGPLLRPVDSVTSFRSGITKISRKEMEIGGRAGREELIFAIAP